MKRTNNQIEVKSQRPLRALQMRKYQSAASQSNNAVPKFALVLVTAPEIKTARSLSKAALKARLVACVNIIPGLESHYWWEGKLTSGKETLLLLKTLKSKLNHLEALVMENHPYENPEFLVMPVNGGSKKYLGWLMENCRQPAFEGKIHRSVRRD